MAHWFWGSVCMHVCQLWHLTVPLYNSHVHHTFWTRLVTSITLQFPSVFPLCHFRCIKRSGSLQVLVSLNIVMISLILHSLFWLSIAVWILSRSVIRMCVETGSQFLPQSEWNNPVSFACVFKLTTLKGHLSWKPNNRNPKTSISKDLKPFKHITPSLLTAVLTFQGCCRNLLQEQN